MKIAIVTGVSRGLGEALAHKLLASSYRVWGVSRNPASIENDMFRMITSDLSKFRAADFDQMWDDVESFDPSEVLLINNAAVTTPAGSYNSHRAPAIEKAFSCNVVAPMALSAELLRRFEQNCCRLVVVNISSGAALRILPGLSVYSCTKRALEFATMGLLEEQQRKGRKDFYALSVRPGIIDTQMQKEAREMPEKDFESKAMFEEFKASGDLKKPSEVADTLLAELLEPSKIKNHVFDLPRARYCNVS